jgi:hypothetical protein
MADENENSRRTPLGVVDTGESKAANAAKNLGEAVSSPIGSDADAAKAAIAEQVTALKEEVAQLRETLGVLAESSGQYAVSQVNSLREDVRTAVVANPFASLLGAALVGYLCGLRRR